MEIIKVDKYASKVESGQIKMFAIAGKKEYEIPDAFKEMCDDEHLAIQLMSVEMSEVLGVPHTYYAPLRTGKKASE